MKIPDTTDLATKNNLLIWFKIDKKRSHVIKNLEIQNDMMANKKISCKFDMYPQKKIPFTRYNAFLLLWPSKSLVFS